jgi:hypothetical protein
METAMNRKARAATLAVLILVLLGAIETSTHAAWGTARRIFIPGLRGGTGDSYSQSSQLRIDNIPIEHLYNALANFGIPSALRPTIVNQEYWRRNPNGLTSEEPTSPAGPRKWPESGSVSAQSYPLPEAEPEGITGWYLTGCTRGEGCAATYQGAGAMTAQWFEFSLGHSNWAPPITCPTGQMCTVLATIPASNLRPLAAQRQWINVRFASTFITPFFLGSACFTIT